MNKIYNKMRYYILFIISQPILLYLIVVIIYLIFFVILQDPCLCQDLDEVSGNVGDASALTSSPALQEAQQHASQEASASQQRVSELKESIEHYKSQGERYEEEYDYWMGLLKEAMNRPEKHKDLEEYIFKKSRESLADFKKYWKKATLAKNIMKEIEKTV